MGPQCPHCGAVYEWTCGELEEQVTAPKVYFCQDCRGLFILTPEEVEALQERFRPALEEATQPEPLEDLLELEEPDDGPERPQAQGSPLKAPAPPMVELELTLREQVLVVTGPHKGIAGVVTVIDGDEVMLRVDGVRPLLRVSITDLQRA